MATSHLSTRRAILAGLGASIPAAAVAAPLRAAQLDPIFSAIEAHKAAFAERQAASRARDEAEEVLGVPTWPDGHMLVPEYAERWKTDPAVQAAIRWGGVAIEAEDEAFYDLLRVVPTVATPEGFRALAVYACGLTRDYDEFQPAYQVLAAFAGVPTVFDRHREEDEDGGDEDEEFNAESSNTPQRWQPLNGRQA